MDTAAADVAPAVSQHRVLIFCQLKSMLDIIEYDLFQYVSFVNCKNILAVCRWSWSAFIDWKCPEGVYKCFAVLKCLLLKNIAVVFVSEVLFLEYENHILSVVFINLYICTCLWRLWCIIVCSFEHLGHDFRL